MTKKLILEGTNLVLSFLLDAWSWFPYKGIPTYPLIHRDEKGEKFAKEYENAIKELKEDGTLAKLSQQYFKEDVFSYVDKD